MPLCSVTGDKFRDLPVSCHAVWFGLTILHCKNHTEVTKEKNMYVPGHGAGHHSFLCILGV